MAQPAPSHAPGGMLSNKGQDYNTHVLYLLPDDASSRKAHQHARGLPGVFICNLKSLSASERPRALTGVPTLVEQDSGRSYRGTHALVELERMQKKELAHNTFGGGHVGHGVGHGVDTVGQPNVSQIGCPIEPFLDDPSRYGNGGRVKERDIDTMRSLRDRLPDPRNPE